MGYGYDRYLPSPKNKYLEDGPPLGKWLVKGVTSDL